MSITILTGGITRHQEWRLFFGQGICLQTSVCTRRAFSQYIRNEGFSAGRIFSLEFLLVPVMRLQRPVSEEEKIPDGKPEGSLSLEKIGFTKGKLTVYDKEGCLDLDCSRIANPIYICEVWCTHYVYDNESLCTVELSQMKSHLSNRSKATPLQCLSKIVGSWDARVEATIRDPVAGFSGSSQAPHHWVWVDVDGHPKQEQGQA